MCLDWYDRMSSPSERFRDAAAAARAAGDIPRLAALLDDAINRAETHEVAVLLDMGVDPGLPDAAGDTPLMNAAWVGSVALVRLLLARGASVNARSAHGDTALQRLETLRHHERTEEHDAVARLLRDAGAE